MADQTNNPPLFPRVMQCGDKSVTEGGMSLRDWYAGQALVGLLSCGQWHNTGAGFAEHIAERSGEIADAMLRVRAPETEA
jgi:hypothetical protein